ncbi:hypothetical protein HW130_32295 [Streptomyces sp. PKU-EA00015]|uniref:hypothetical protein n=1 Tax=Streptomyces sp. PKU-EA00015 TaxID=2748326 RepID=UPI0015A2899A|nr:hypothetical protein [Streptomyces sp. PKU-EA00015]NWF30873.1 hypothetical protein [Streptomyces sp. PKU-EA00015]
MTLDIQQQAARRMRRAVFALGGIIVVLVVVIVVIAVTGGRSTNNDSSNSPAPGTSATGEPEPVETLPDDGGYVAPEEYVKLPDGTSKAGNLPIKFARTPEGAAAAGVAATRNAYSWNAAQVRAGINTYSAAAYRDEMAAQVEESVKANREYAGIPATGPVPEGATLSAWPIGVQWQRETSNSVDLLILLRVTYSAGTGEKSTTNLVVTPTRAVWESGDWKVEPTPPSENLPDPVDIGTARFNLDGWKAIQEGERL